MINYYCCLPAVAADAKVAVIAKRIYFMIADVFLFLRECVGGYISREREGRVCEVFQRMRRTTGDGTLDMYLYQNIFPIIFPQQPRSKEHKHSYHIRLSVVFLTHTHTHTRARTLSLSLSLSCIRSSLLERELAFTFP